MQTYLRLLRYVKPYKFKLFIAMIAMGIVAVSTSGPAWLAKDVFDRIFVSAENIDPFMLLVLPGALILIFSIKGAFYYLQAILMGTIGHGIIKDLRDELYTKYMDLSLRYFTDRSTAELMSRVTNDVKLIEGAVTRAITGLLQHSLSAIALLAVIFYTNWKLAIIASVVFPIAVYPVAFLAKRLKKYSTKSQEKMSNLNTLLMESFTGIRIVQAFRRQKFEVDRFEKETGRLYDLEISQVKVSAIPRPLMEVFGAIGGGAAIYVGGLIIMKGSMTPGDLARFLTAVFLLFDPVRQLNGLNQAIMQGIAAAERVFEVLDTVSDITEKEDAIEMSPLKEVIEFRDVSFSYDEAPVITKLDLSLNKGKILAIVGSSGGGKTTLVNLLPRFYDVTEGSILFDGVDIRDASLNSLRAQIAIVTQQTILFNDTVRNNISYGLPDLPQEEVVGAARAAFAHEFIEQLPEGYETIIGEKGVRLSGGQCQRLSIARALLKNAPILILDEATSALDTESEKQVQRAINRLMEGRTSFVIAHRLSTILHADRIIVLSGGHIVESGTHQELYKNNGEYRRLYDLQFVDSEGNALASHATES
jgi:ATP-binding cassette, subfamily B, bacterial MsbA